MYARIYGHIWGVHTRIHGHIWGQQWGMHARIHGHIWGSNGACMRAYMGHVWGSPIRRAGKGFPVILFPSLLRGRELPSLRSLPFPSPVPFPGWGREEIPCSVPQRMCQSNNERSTRMSRANTSPAAPSSKVLLTYAIPPPYGWSDDRMCLSLIRCDSDLRPAAAERSSASASTMYYQTWFPYCFPGLSKP